MCVCVCVFVCRAGIKVNILQCISLQYSTHHLSQCVGESDGKEEVGIGRPSVDPEIPQHRAQDRGNQKHTQHHQTVPQVYQGRCSEW